MVRTLYIDSMAQHTLGKGKYVEGAPLVELFETKGRARILDVFLRKHYQKLTSENIAYYAGVDESTFSRNKDLLLEMEVIKQVESDQRASTYKLNTDSPIVHALQNLQTELIDYVDEIQNDTIVYNKRQVSEKLFSGNDDKNTDNQPFASMMQELDA